MTGAPSFRATRRQAVRPQRAERSEARPKGRTYRRGSKAERPQWTREVRHGRERGGSGPRSREEEEARKGIAGSGIGRGPNEALQRIAARWRLC